MKNKSTKINNISLKRKKKLNPKLKSFNNVEKKALINYGVYKSLNLKLKKQIGLILRLISSFNKKQHKVLFKNSMKEIKIINKFKIKEIIEFLKKIKTYKGIRHKLKYPCRGQRTHTNAKTVKKLLI